MKVEDLILQLQDVISAAKSMPFSGGKVMVSSDEIYDILDQIQDAMPAEVSSICPECSTTVIPRLPELSTRFTTTGYPERKE